MEYLLTLDQGTSSSRAIIFSRVGQVVASTRQKFPQHFPQPGWMEYDPFDVWNSRLTTCRAALERTKFFTADMVALDITNQRETTMMRECAIGRPIFDVIVQQNRHIEAICEHLYVEDLEDEIRKRTDLIIDPYFSATELRWILDYVDDARKRIARGELTFGTIDS